VLEYLHAWAHPWVVKTRSEMVGEGPTTCDGGFAETVTAASCALVAVAVGGGLRRYNMS
jgi:hypothetical protein